VTILGETFDIEATPDPVTPDVATAGCAPPEAALPEPVVAEVAADFVEVYTAHYHRVVRALELGGLNRAGAEDTAQEAFARTLGHWPRVRTGSNPAGYVYRVAFRLGRRSLRREAPLLTDVAAPGDMAAAVVTRTAVEAVVAAMPHRRRSCVVLCLVVGLSTKEAAQALGIAEGTVRKQIERGRADLRVALGGSDS
jgi:RNA polymerase sigma factor (sigma-70 family)